MAEAKKFIEKSPMHKAMDEANRKAREKEIDREKVLTDDEMSAVNDIADKAAKRGMKLVPEKRIKNKARFVQIIQVNWTYLEEKDYLTSEEIVFLMKLVPYIGLHSNGIVDDPRKKQPIAMNQTEIGETLKTSKTKVSRVVNALVKKGILARSESGIEGVNAKSFCLFVNPHILFSGDRDKIEEGLRLQFQKPMKMKVMKDLPERFF